MPYVEGLRCRECARPYPAEALHVCEWCFGPLEVVYDYDAIRAAVTRESIAAGPLSIWRYADLLPAAAEGAVEPGRRVHPAGPGRPAGRRARPRRGVDQERHPQPDRILQGPGGVGGAHQGPGARASRWRPAASTGNLANSVAAHAAQAGMESVVFIPADLEAGKVVTTAVFGGRLIAVDGNYDDVNRLCAELAADRPSWAFVNVNVRTYYAEGSKTLAFEVAEQLGWQAPDHVVVPVASGQPADQGRQGLPGAVHAWACSTRSRTCGCRGRRRPAARRWPRPSTPARDVIRPVQAGHHRQVPGHRRPGRRRLRPGGGAGVGRCLRGGHRRGDHRRHPAAGPHRGHLRRDGRRRDHRHPGPAGRNRG